MAETHGAVMDAPPAQTREALHALVEAKQAEYAQLAETHADLWARRKRAELDRDGYIDFMWHEDRMALLLQELDHLRPQLRAAEVREAVETAQAHHDEAVPEALALAQQAVQALCAVAPLWQRLGEVFDAQQTPLVGFRDTQGNQAFPFLPGGQGDLMNLGLQA